MKPTLKSLPMMTTQEKRHLLAVDDDRSVARLQLRLLDELCQRHKDVLTRRRRRIQGPTVQLELVHRHHLTTRWRCDLTVRLNFVFRWCKVRRLLVRETYCIARFVLDRTCTRRCETKSFSLIISIASCALA